MIQTRRPEGGPLTLARTVIKLTERCNFRYEITPRPGKCLG